MRKSAIFLSAKSGRFKYAPIQRFNVHGQASLWISVQARLRRSRTFDAQGWTLVRLSTDDRSQKQDASPQLSDAIYPKLLICNGFSTDKTLELNKRLNGQEPRT